MFQGTSASSQTTNSGPSVNLVQRPQITCTHTPIQLNTAVSQCSEISVVQSPCISGGSSVSPAISVVQSPIIKDYLGRINIAQSPQIVSPTVSIQNIGVSVPLVSNAGPSCSQGAHVSGNSTPVVAQAPSSGQIGLPQKSPAVNVIAGLLQQIVSSSGSRPSASLSHPSVLVQPSPRIEMSNLFWVMFLTGNISRCQGCGGKIERGADGKVLPPPNDLVVQHKEQVVFQNPNTGTFQLSRDNRNVYYHPRLLCLQRKFSSFEAAKHIKVSQQIFLRMTIVHKQYLTEQFAIQIIAGGH